MSRWKRYLLVGAICLVAVLVVANTKTNVPAEPQGTLNARGRVSECDFQNIGGRHGSQFFLGITLDTPGTPYLRFNGNRAEREKYEELCSRKPEVKITYRAVQRVIGPLRFWVEQIHEG